MAGNDRFQVVIEAASQTILHETGNSTIHTGEPTKLPGTNILIRTIDDLLDADND